MKVIYLESPSHLVLNNPSNELPVSIQQTHSTSVSTTARQSKVEKALCKTGKRDRLLHFMNGKR
jgi:hypothetical protein